MQQVLLSSLDDREELRHRRDLFTLLLEEPVQELLADELALLARELHEVDDLLGDPLLLREREGHGSDDIRECGLRCVDTGRDHVFVGVEEVLHHHHRVVPFLHCLAVEVRCKLWEVLGVVVGRDGDVLL